MNSALICHADDPLSEEGFSRWLASFSDLKVVVRIADPASQFWKRLHAERRRSGWPGLLDVFAFRACYRLFRAGEDRRWSEQALAALRERYPSLPASCRVVAVDSPNHPDVAEALREASVDFAVARCKRILARRIFSIPRHGVFVVHPGICPEYRNSHGCFWAVVGNDDAKVGATLLRIDEGVDTGPVLGYFRIDFDPIRESHIRIQERAVFENLDGISAAILGYAAGELPSIDTSGRRSAAWGQPRLSAFLRWRLSRRRRD